MINVASYKFNDEKLFFRALTHSSYSFENYERLEFLGDSILDFVVGNYFYKLTDLNEGYLTKMRAHYVSEDNLSLVFDKLNISDYIKLGKSCKKVTKSMKCDMFESIIGAIYLDSSLKDCEKFILDNIFTEPINSVVLIDNKSLLQEYAQGNKLEKPTYDMLEKKGASHNPTFVVKAKCGNFEATAENKSIKLAEQDAAKIILEIISKEKNKWILSK